MDFLVIAVLLVSVRVRPGAAAVIGFLTGLLADAVTPATFGAGALALSLVAFGASWLKAVFFADNILLHASFFFAGKWAFDIVFLIAEHARPMGELVIQVVLWSPLAAAVTALTGLVVLVLFRGMLEAPAA
jgi:rod shape-determining protein MreD